MRWIPLRWLPGVRLGRGVSISGRVWVHGGGRVLIGDRARLEARSAPIELHAAAGAEILIGEDAVIEGGASVEALERVTIGDRCRVGAYAKIMDNHFHPLHGDRHVKPPSLPVVLEPEARIGRRAVVLPGARIRGGVAVPPATVVRATPRGARRRAEPR